MGTRRGRTFLQGPSLEPIQHSSLLLLILQAAPLLLVGRLGSFPLSLSILFPRPVIITQEIPERKELGGDLAASPVDVDVNLSVVLIESEGEKTVTVPLWLAEMQNESKLL